MAASRITEFTQLPSIKAFLELLRSQELMFAQGNWDKTSDYVIEKLTGPGESADEGMFAIHLPPPKDKGRRPDHGGISFYFTAYGSLCGILTFENGEPCIGSLKRNERQESCGVTQ